MIEATGPDACEALDAIGNLFDKKFASNDSNAVTHSEKTQQEKQVSGTSARINAATCEGVADRNTNS